MITAYDYPSAQVAEEAGVDVVLVGDSGAMTVLGYPSTVPVSVDEMLMLCSAVRRGLTTPMLVGDLPFGSYEGSNEQAIATAQRFVKEAGCRRGQARARRLVRRARGGDRRRGHPRDGPRRADAADRDRARRLPLAGAHGRQGRWRSSATRWRCRRRAASRCVFEAVPSELTELAMPRIEMPVIGIGAGPATDGQVLVFHDLLGIYDGHAARFVKRYGDVRQAMIDGVAAFAADVRERRYPEPEHGYTMAPDEAERLRQLLT